jgi:exonuclease RecJ (EC 3.1.-.-)
METIFVQRHCDATIASEIEKSGKPKVLAKILASRGELPGDGNSLKDILPWNGARGFKGVLDAANILADAVQGAKKIVIVADYDADGATACAVGIRSLRAMGAIVDFAAPDRMTMGYGLSVDVIDFVVPMKPDLLLTVDNGISSHAGINYAAELGIPVVVTDHHLAGETVPDAVAIVNPNQPGCPFPSKNLAGVGTIFYAMLALRHVLKERGHFADGKNQIPNMAALLDLVALGTVADIVKLDRNNRILVAEGLKRIAADTCNPGIAALSQVAMKDRARLTSVDLGFVIGPRLNAAGRMDDMSVGIQCLTTDNADEAMELAKELDRLNKERREVETTMRADVERLLPDTNDFDRYTLAVYDPEWHPGVIGILASRIKERINRPVITFAKGTVDGEIRGSGRSISGFHLRDVMERIHITHPGLIIRFGGHAMAAGLTIDESRLDEFKDAFEKIGREWMTPEILSNRIEHDGAISLADASVELVEKIGAEIWGQGFPEPLFAGDFRVVKQKIMKEKHSKLTLEQGGKTIEAVLFNFADKAPERIKAFYTLMVNEWNGAKKTELNIKHIESAA